MHPVKFDLNTNILALVCKYIRSLLEHIAKCYFHHLREDGHHFVHIKSKEAISKVLIILQ